VRATGGGRKVEPALPPYFGASAASFGGAGLVASVWCRHAQGERFLTLPDGQTDLFFRPSAAGWRGFVVGPMPVASVTEGTERTERAEAPRFEAGLLGVRTFPFQGVVVARKPGRGPAPTATASPGSTKAPRGATVATSVDLRAACAPAEAGQG
jgi:hypothetical protein